MTMATSKSTQTQAINRDRANQSLPFRGSLPPPHSGVTLTVESCGGNFLLLEYSADDAQQLLDCGAVTAEMLAMPRRARKRDSLGFNVGISRRRGICIVRRYREDGQYPLPGVEPWMLKRHLEHVGTESRRAREWAQRDREAVRETLMLEFERKAPVLEPQAWRERRMKRLDYIGYLATAADPDPANDHLSPEYVVLEADRLAFMARVNAMHEELTGMLSRLRIVRAEFAAIPLDVERQVGQILRRFTEVRP